MAKSFIVVKNSSGRFYTGKTGRERWRGFAHAQKFPATIAGADEARKAGDYSLEQWVQSSENVAVMVGNVYTWNQHNLLKK